MSEITMEQKVEIKRRMDLITRNTREIIDIEKIEDLVREQVVNGGRKPRLYIGFEPSGLCHFGWQLVCHKIRDYLDADVDVTIFFADWHAQINNKLGGHLDDIRVCAEYMKDAFESLGVPRDKVNYVFASEIMDQDYWGIVIRIGSVTTEDRVKRAMTIMGRKAGRDTLNAVMFMYPLMQPADIFRMDMDIGYGGLDQRRAHMLARESADKLSNMDAERLEADALERLLSKGVPLEEARHVAAELSTEIARKMWKSPAAIHTDLVPGLKAMSRMNPQDSKMSKSKPDAGILIHDSENEIMRKFSKAFCPMPGEFDNTEVDADMTDTGDVDSQSGNPVLKIAELLLFRDGKSLEYTKPQRFGGETLVFGSFKELEKAYMDGLHPNDLKAIVGKGVADALAPSREYFERNHENLDKFKTILERMAARGEARR